MWVRNHLKHLKGMVMFLYNNKAHNSCIKPFKLGLNGWGKPLLQVFNAKYYICRICLHTQCENTAKNLLSTALSFLILRLGGNILEIFKFYKYSKYSLKKMMGEKCELHMDKRLCIKNGIVRCQTRRFLKSKHSGFNCNSSFFMLMLQEQNITMNFDGRDEERWHH